MKNSHVKTGKKIRESFVKRLVHLSKGWSICQKGGPFVKRVVHLTKGVVHLSKVCPNAHYLYYLDTGGAATTFKRRSLFERNMTLPVGTWSVARKQSICSVGVHVCNLTTSYFDRRETKFSATRPLFTVELALFYVFSLSNPLVCVPFLHLSDQSDKQEKARSLNLTLAKASSPSHNRDGNKKARTFDKRTHHHKDFDRQRFVSAL